MEKTRYGVKPMSLNMPTAIQRMKLSLPPPAHSKPRNFHKMQPRALQGCTVQYGLKPYTRIRLIPAEKHYMLSITMKTILLPYPMIRLLEKAIRMKTGLRGF